MRVQWEIDYEDGGTPKEAARYAWDLMRKPDSTACVFVVHDDDGTTYMVDLMEGQV